MATNNENRPRVSPFGMLRRVGIGVAAAELAYLVYWMGMDLGLIGGATMIPLTPPGAAPPASLAGLMLGMVWTAAFGGLAGLIVNAGLILVGRPASAPPPPTRYAFARSLVVRNQRR